MSFQYLLMANYTMYLKVLMKRLGDTGLTPGQPRVLDYLSGHNGACQAEIAAACLVEAASLTSTLNGMEQKGLVERRRGEGDRRSYYIFLTEKGKALCRAVEETFARMEEQVFAALPGTGRADMMETLERLNGAIGALYGKELDT